MSAPGLTVGELLPRLDAGENVLILDVRNDEEFQDWRLDGRRPVETLHIPYFDFIEDAPSAVARVPRGRPVVVLCAKGGSSELVVTILAEAGIAAANISGGMQSYGEHLEPVRLATTEAEAGRFEIWQLNRRGKGCLSYVIRSQDEAIVVDPARQVERYEGFVKSLGARIARVLDTHVHADHVSGGPALAARNSVPYFVSAGAGFELRHAVSPLADGEQLRLGGEHGVTLEVRLLSTPGHTPGSTSYLVGSRHLLTGDTLFVSSVGRPDLGGHVVEWGRALFHTLRERIATLPDDTLVLPAHYAGVQEIGVLGAVVARLGDLRRSVPELRIETEEAFVEALRAAVKAPPASYAEMIRVNLGLAAASPERIGEWELGKNQCAVATSAR